MYLSKKQIERFISKVGQPKASNLLNNFLVNYGRYLDSEDVKDLYDENYYNRINSHKTVEIVDGKYKINLFNIRIGQLIHPLFF